MRARTTVSILALLVLTATAALAYTPYGGTGYTTSNIYNRQSFTQSGTMYGYGQGYAAYGNGVYGAYSTVDGYRLTEHGPYPYPPSARFVSDTQFRGHYDVWTGQYYDAWSGRTVSQYPRQSGGVPAANYPGNPYVVDRYY